MSEHTLSCQARSIGDYGVVVCGGGPAGVGAAIVAAREGAEVLLVEQAGCLGGAGTNALVNVWHGNYTRDHKERVVAGIFQETVDRLVAEGGAIPAEKDVVNATPHMGYGAIHGRTTPFDVEICKRVLESFVLDEGVRLRYFTSFVAPDVEDGRIQGLFVHGKSGMSYIKTKVVVDATGDADVAYRTGCPTAKGTKEQGLMTPGTLMFMVEDVDSKAVEKYCKETGDVRYRRIIKKLQETGGWKFSYEIILLCETGHKGTFAVNTQRQCGVDGTSEESMTEGIIQARREIAELMDIFRKHVDGFENSRLTVSAPMIGIRETRRIVGEYVLGMEEIGKETHHKDTIAFSGFGWDLPDPKKPSTQPMWEQKKAFGLPYTEVPYRCLVPQGIENLLVAGRCISVERDVLGPLRTQPTCFATGQAAGTAAAWSAETSVPAAGIDTDKLRQRLVESGAIVSCNAKADIELLEKWESTHRKECGAFGEEPEKPEQDAIAALPNKGKGKQLLENSRGAMVTMDRTKGIL